MQMLRMSLLNEIDAKKKTFLEQDDFYYLSRIFPLVASGFYVGSENGDSATPVSS